MGMAIYQPVLWDGIEVFIHIVLRSLNDFAWTSTGRGCHVVCHSVRSVEAMHLADLVWRQKEWRAEL